MGEAERILEEGGAGAPPPPGASDDDLRTLSRRVGPAGSSQVEVAVVTGGIAPAVADVPGAAVASLRVSPDAVGFLQWLDMEDPGCDVLPHGRSLIIELGCGVGLVGLACAGLRPEACAVLTDVAALLPRAQRSVSANGDALASRISVRPLPFGDAGALDAILAEHLAASERGGSDIDSHPAIVAVGAGIFYWECVYAPLAETLERLCSAGGSAVLGYFRRDWKVERRFWTKLLPQHGLQVEVLWEGVVQEPGDTGSFAPVCTRTPGEWNGRVYRVSRLAPDKEADASYGGGVAARNGTEEASEMQPWLAYGGGNKRGGKQRKAK